MDRNGNQLFARLFRNLCCQNSRPTTQSSSIRFYAIVILHRIELLERALPSFNCFKLCRPNVMIDLIVMCLNTGADGGGDLITDGKNYCEPFGNS